MKKYNLVVCGGTFDHLHIGHKEFLRYGLSIANKLLVGLTSDSYVKNSKFAESYKIRKKSLEEFLNQEKVNDRVQIEPIEDIYIPKIWEDFPIEAIIVTQDTIKGAQAINLKRLEQKKYPLEIKIVRLLNSTNNGHISSSRIRNGNIGRNGEPYLNSLWLSNDLVITEDVRKELKKPFGELIKNNEFGDLKCPYLITVGDATTKLFNELGFNQNISVVDFKIARYKKFSDFKELGFLGTEKVVNANNPPGSLTSNLFKKTSCLFSKNDRRIILKIEGEDDLCVLPVVLTAPLGSLVFYGQPGKGIVKVLVSEKNKKKAYDLAGKFSVCTRGY